MGLFGKKKADDPTDIESGAVVADDPASASQETGGEGKRAAKGPGVKVAGRLRSALASIAIASVPAPPEEPPAPPVDPEAAKKEEEFKAKVKEEFEKMRGVFRVERHYEKAVESMERVAAERRAASAPPAPGPDAAPAAGPAGPAPAPSAGRVIGARHSITTRVQ